MEDQDRNDLLQLPPNKMQDIANFCNRYPDIEVKYELTPKQKLTTGDRVHVVVNLLRDPDDEEAEELKTVPIAATPRYSIPKTEGWWLVLGNPSTNELVAIKRVAFKKRSIQEKLEFVAPSGGNYEYMLYLMSDSYMGVDQEFKVELKVSEGKSQQEQANDKEEDGETSSDKPNKHNKDNDKDMSDDKDSKKKSKK